MVVLVVEDDILTRSALVQVLREEGYLVVQASDGQQAWEIFCDHRPDFVCLDVMMPRLNGYELCRKIRALDAKIPLIFITAKHCHVGVWILGWARTFSALRVA